MDNKPISESNPPVSAAGTENLSPMSSPKPPPMADDSSTVVIPKTQERMPFWFYILFAVVAVTFFSITFLLVKTLLQRSGSTSTESISNTPILPSPTVVLSPTVIPVPEDEYLNSLNSESDSDEIIDIEADLEKTAINELTTDFSKLEAETNLGQ